jgi:DegV family protein with EDD domain
MLAARGNSGNIAAQFLAGVLAAESTASLGPAFADGRARAWQAVHNPVTGTMLGVFDALAAFMTSDDAANQPDFVPGLLDRLEAAVRTTHDELPRLKRAGVVDSGALGMFIFLEGFFRHLFPGHNGYRKIAAIFRNRLTVAASFEQDEHPRYCIDSVVRLDGGLKDIASRLDDVGSDTVLIPHGDVVKVHLHTASRQSAREALESVGRVVKWTDDDIARQVQRVHRQVGERNIHIMSDAAGSVTREDARRLGITLLSSYITIDDTCLPETLVSPQTLYRAMAAGKPVSTAQASTFERHQHYRRVLEQYDQVLYLCVGAAFTGNYETAMQWKQANDPENRFTVIDTGSASGRLGAAVMAVARRAAAGDDAPAVIRYAHRAVTTCREFIFLERLKYLAAGGRLSKTRAVMGDLLRLKPVVSPTPQGARKVGAVKNKAGQVAYALKEIDALDLGGGAPFILLEYTDNRAWIDARVLPALRDRLPAADIRVQPLSLTTGVHTGPGTWAVAVLPGEDK